MKYPTAGKEIILNRRLKSSKCEMSYEFVSLPFEGERNALLNTCSIDIPFILEFLVFRRHCKDKKQVEI
jgi:hypothetical protein